PVGVLRFPLPADVAEEVPQAVRRGRQVLAVVGVARGGVRQRLEESEGGAVGLAGGVVLPEEAADVADLLGGAGGLPAERRAVAPAAARALRARRPAAAGRRRHHIAARSHAGVRRARTGSPAANRRRSSARSAALA